MFHSLANLEKERNNTQTKICNSYLDCQLHDPVRTESLFLDEVLPKLVILDVVEKDAVSALVELLLHSADSFFHSRGQVKFWKHNKSVLIIQCVSS